MHVGRGSKEIHIATMRKGMSEGDKTPIVFHMGYRAKGGYLKITPQELDTDHTSGFKESRAMGIVRG